MTRAEALKNRKNDKEPDKDKAPPAEYKFENLIFEKVLSPYEIAKWLFIISIFLLTCHILVIHFGYLVLRIFRHSSNLPFYQQIYYTLFDQFHLGKEENIATYFSSLLLGGASALLCLIHFSWKGKVSHWIALSFFFLFLSVDESIQIHETFGGLAGQIINSYMDEVPSFLKWAWMIPYSVLVIFVVIYFFRFTLLLPSKTRILFFLSGSIFVFAALILEFFESHFDETYGPDNMVNKFLFPFEEVLEMVGIVIFIYSLLDYLRKNNWVLQFSFSPIK